MFAGRAGRLRLVLRRLGHWLHELLAVHCRAETRLCARSPRSSQPSHTFSRRLNHLWLHWPGRSATSWRKWRWIKNFRKKTFIVDKFFSNNRMWGNKRPGRLIFSEAIKKHSKTHQNPIGFVYSPLWKSPIKSHRFCVLPPLKNHPPKPVGFVYSSLWKITVFGGRLSRVGAYFGVGVNFGKYGIKLFFSKTMLCTGNISSRGFLLTANNKSFLT